jgi:antitoxin (DNA-binding transcriptional repressor) of toxin-antitoxin stability system
MKFIPSRDLRTRPGRVWSHLRKEKELVVTSHGRPVAIMMPVTGDDLESTLRMLRAAQFHETIRQVQRRSVEKGTDRTTMEEIDREVRKARKSSRA